jgi:ribosome-binding protein aMBF1 (putative translation factor)
MYCKICGSPTAKYRERSRMTLCADCHHMTPAKVSREMFDHMYWGDRIESVPASTRREFWEDYQSSTIGPVEVYIARTTSQAF